jgi:diguanylate cyclase (GGDEF)-like protein
MHFTLNLSIFVAVSNLTGMMFYTKAVAEVFKLPLKAQRCIFVQAVHLIALIVLILLSAKLSWIRFTTMLAIMSCIFFFILEAYLSSYKYGNWDMNTRVLIVALFVYHFIWAVIYSISSTYEEGTDSLLITMNLFTISMMMLIVWINFSVFFASYSRLANEYRHLSYHDHLTKLPNRRNIMHQIERHIELVKRKQTPFGILSIDLNHFKEVNDQYGHLVGDEFLIEFGDIMVRESRSTDLVARVGGDEFMILVIVDSEKQLEQSVIRLQQTLRNYRLTEHNITPDFEFGKILINSDNVEKDLEQLLEQLDQDLYKSKRQ